MTELERKETITENNTLDGLVHVADASATTTVPETSASNETTDNETTDNETTSTQPPTEEPPAQSNENESDQSAAQANQTTEEDQAPQSVDGSISTSDEQEEQSKQEAFPQATTTSEPPTTTPPTGDAATEPPTTTADTTVDAVEPSTTETTTSSEASFTPVPEGGVRPRRIKDLQVAQELQGQVTSVALYGVFVDIGVGRDGLVHISEMSDTRINTPSDMVQIGDVVNVRVKSVDVEARRISLTMRSKERTSGQGRGGGARRAEINREALENLKVGDVVEGTITGLAQFGAFVDIGVGKDGLVHISELSDNRVEKPEDAVELHRQYTFKLLEIDPEGNRISLSLRRAQRSQKLQQLTPDQILEGRVSGMAPFGAFVDIGVGRDGLVHISQLSENHVGKVEDIVKEGDSVTVRVLEVDPQSKRISLTMRLEDPPADEETPPQENEQAATSPTTEPQQQTVEPTPRQRSFPTQPRQPQQRSSRDEGRRSRRDRDTAPLPPTPEVYVAGSDADEEEFEGNATLEDLVSKFSKGNSRKDRRRRKDDNNEEEEHPRGSRQHMQRQREAQRRTLRRIDEEE